MPIEKLKAFLDENRIKYVTTQHSIAYTAQEVAAVSHIPGAEMAKTVMVLADGKMAMAVVPASHRLDLDRLADLAGAQQVRIAREEEFRDLFPTCDLGAMPPFGNLYDVPVYASEALAEDIEISFNAGSHAEVMRLGYRDFERLAGPTLGRFSHRVP